MTNPNLLLDPRQTLQKIKRIAYEICEHNLAEQSIVLAGIYDEGYFLAKMLETELQAIAPFQVVLLKITLDKTAQTQPQVTLDQPALDFNDKVVIICDDVLNSGRTLMYATQPFVAQHCKKLQIAVLVERSHRRFPIRADYVGYALATTLQEHVTVNLHTPYSMGAYLN
jgi:pyrimidine operon attenuation protein/uracil phosphoribosyltransferase